MNRSLSSRQMKKQNVFSRISKMRSWFSLCKFLGFSSGRTQNPPVLWLAEIACSCPGQPLSATHGHQRYHTLDFARKVVCRETAGFIGCFLPRRVLPSIGCLLPRQRRRLWKPLPRGAGRQWRPQSVADTLKHRPSRQARPLSPLESSANRALPAPIGLPKAKGIAVPLESQMRFEMSTHK